MLLKEPLTSLSESFFVPIFSYGLCGDNEISVIPLPRFQKTEFQQAQSGQLDHSTYYLSPVIGPRIGRF
jgi:hypothetical protein